MEYRTCNTCDNEYPLNEDNFRLCKSRSNTNKYYTRKCRGCINEQAKIAKSSKEAKQRQAEYMKTWKRENKEHVNKYKMKVYYDDRDKHLKKCREYYQRNKEHIKKRNYAYKKKRLQSDIGFKIKENLRRRLNHCIKKVGTSKSNGFNDLLGCDIQTLKSYIEDKFTDGMTWENYGKWHIDHIIPCASFDLNNPEQQKKCFHYTNLQPLWAHDNMRKSDRLNY